MTPNEHFVAKRLNEGVRLAATFLNNLAVGTIIAGFLSPFASGHPLPIGADLALFSAAGALHFLARLTLHRLLRREE